MRFIVMGMATKESEAGTPPKPEAYEAMGKYNDELVKAGVLLAAEGLVPSSKGARVKFSGDKRTVIDGPFAETKEVLGGYYIVDCGEGDAIEIAKRIPVEKRSWVEVRRIALFHPNVEKVAAMAQPAR